MKKKVVIWGASGHSLVVADILRLQGDYEIAGLLDDFNSKHRMQQASGLPILGGRDKLGVLRHEGVTHLIFGFGDCAARFQLAPLVEKLGFEFATAIHPHATVAAGVSIGSGIVVAAGAVINPGASIGRNCIINTGASVDHECVIGEAVHLGPGARLGGRVSVGDEVWVGIGATILDRRRIGARSIVGAGALVTKDVDTGAVVYGVPAKYVRSVAEQAERHITEK